MPTRSGQSIKLWAYPQDAGGHIIPGLKFVWSTLDEDHLWTTEADSNLWTVRGHAEIHTISVRLKARPEMGASYHAWVFDQNLQLQLVGAPLPAVMTVGESIPIRVRVLTADGIPVSGVPVTFSMEIRGWVPCGQYEVCPKLVGTVSPADGWVGGDKLWVRTNEGGDAAGIFTADTLRWADRFDPHFMVPNVICTSPSVADAVFDEIALHAGPATQIRDDGVQNQRGQVGTTLSDPFWVVVTDRYGNRVENEPVAWTVVQGGGSLVFASKKTDQYGRAVARLVLGSEPGPQSVVASIAAGASVTFTAIATP